MTPDTNGNAQLKKASTEAVHTGHAARRRLITALTVLAFLAIGWAAIYAMSLILGAITLLLVSALLAYLIYPLVAFLQRRMRRALAITVAYLLIAGVMTGVMFIVTSALIQQSTSLALSVRFLLSPAGKSQLQPLIDFLGKLGVTNDQVVQYKNQLLSQVLGALSGLLPFLSGLVGNVIYIIVVATLSVYFVVDGPRIIGWLRLETPVTRRDSITFLLHALDQSLGGYFRGNLLIALIGALATGVGLALLHVQYAALLGTLFFFLYFVPVIGAYVIGVLCILAALPLGWVVTLIVAVYITLLQAIVIGQILSPRIFSKTVGVHPIVALFALIAFGELFGLLGGLLAIPVAGVLQQIVVTLWKRWKNRHPDQFPPESPSAQEAALLPVERIPSGDTPVPDARSRQ
jgi:predicted PurR-regulated permease PerM